MPLELLSKYPWKIFLTTLCLSGGGSFLFGVSMTIFNPSEGIFRKLINESHTSHYGYALSGSMYDFIWPLILNLQIVGCGLGALPLGKLAENLGRKKTFYISAGLAILGLVLQAVSKMCLSWEMLAVGRFVLGFSSGLSLPLESMYYNEISPPRLRGFFCSVVGVCLELGFVTGGILPLPMVLGTETLWPWMFAIQIFPVLVVLAVLPFLHESPRHLLARGRSDECRKSLLFFGHESSRIEESVQEISADIKSQKGQVKWGELWRRAYLRKGTLMGCLVQLTVVMSGIVAIEFYSTRILINVGLDVSTAQFALIGMLAASFIGAMIGSSIVEKAGRRLLLLSTTAIMILMNALVMIMSIVFDAYKFKWTGYVSIAACTVLIVAFGIGPSVLQWVLPVETVPQNARSATQIVVSVVKNVGFLLAGVTFYPMQITIGPYCFLPSIIVLIGLFIAFAVFLPETKGKNIVEIMEALGYTDKIHIGVLKESA